MVNAATILRTSAATISDIYMIPEYGLPRTSIYLYYIIYNIYDTYDIYLYLYHKYMIICIIYI